MLTSIKIVCIFFLQKWTQLPWKPVIFRRITYFTRSRQMNDFLLKMRVRLTRWTCKLIFIWWILLPNARWYVGNTIYYRNFYFAKVQQPIKSNIPEGHLQHHDETNISVSVLFFCLTYHVGSPNGYRKRASREKRRVSISRDKQNRCRISWWKAKPFIESYHDHQGKLQPRGNKFTPNPSRKM